MNEAALENQIVKDRFAVAQVALYLYAILQVVVALTTAAGAVPIGILPQASTIQRVSATTNAVVNVLCCAVGYVLLARCLNRCTKLVWRMALSVFLINAGVAALAMAAQPGPYPVLMCSLAIAGAISVWNGRSAVQSYSSAESHP
jgi:hypothetical protein